MKNLKFLLGFALFGMLIFTSCSDKDVTLENIETSIIDDDVQSITIEDFLDLSLTENSFHEITSIENPALESRSCSTCNPCIKSLAMYNLGGYERGFGVSTSMNGVCTKDKIIWGATSGGNVTWVSSGQTFARIVFPGPGTYQVTVNFKVRGPSGIPCITSKTRTVTI